MKKLSSRLIALLLTLAMALSMLPMAVFAVATHPTEVATVANDPVQIKKSVTDNGDGTYKITMESYVTGTIKPSEAVPLDIVLVLDQSGSMAYNFAGGSTSDNSSRRQYAMKQAVNNFIGAVGADSSNHRIALVTFGSSASQLSGWTATNPTGVNSLTTALP